MRARHRARSCRRPLPTSRPRARTFSARDPPLAAEARRRYAWVRATLARVESPGSGVVTQAAKLVDWINRPWPSTVLFIALMAIVFQAVFAWATPARRSHRRRRQRHRLADRRRLAGRHARELRRRRRDRRRRQRHRVPAADPDPVPVHHPDGGHGLSRARGVPRRPRDAHRGPVRSVRDSAAVELRLRRAFDHGDARHSESPRPHRDDPGRAVHDLLGALARLCAC